MTESLAAAMARSAREAGYAADPQGASQEAAAEVAGRGLARDDRAFAIEFAEYMAKDAERLLDAVNEHAAALMALEEGSDADNDDDNASMALRCEHAEQAVDEHMRGLRDGVYEFRKRAKKAHRAPQVVAGPATQPAPQAAAEPADGGEPYAYAIHIDAEQRMELVHSLDDAVDELTNCDCEVVKLYTESAVRAAIEADRRLRTQTVAGEQP